MKFTLSVKNPQTQYLQIEAEIKTSGTETTIFFPAWRPGRYELGDFAKNINNFQIITAENKLLSYKKTSKNSWLVATDGHKKITVKYTYYAADLNAGSTFLDADQLYVNPVNCFLFTEAEANAPIQVKLKIPKDWKIAHSLPVKDNIFEAKNYDELADSPFICSENLQHKSYRVSGTTFHVWFNGIVKPNWDQLIADFRKFTSKQIEKYTEFPVKDYHFLFQILPYKAYHGVEHCKSTVIAFGPSYAIFEELYTEFLGVSSHELYHSWNIKSIRPIEMMPYDFKKENYSELGYIAEGVTTYMGDLMLLKSGVFDLPQYLKEMSTQLQKHADNFGRLSYSVAQSSFDTWLDGYVPGAPGRKVSIYTEGCLLAFIVDVLLRKYTGNKFGIDEVMRRLYFKFAKNEKGISDHDYQTMIEEVGGKKMDWFFKDYVHGVKPYWELLEECFKEIGLLMKTTASDSYFATKIGAKIEEQAGKTKIVAIYPESIIDRAGGMLGDEILSINNIRIEGNLDRWAAYFAEEEKELVIARKGQLFSLKLPKSKTDYFLKYGLVEVENASKKQLQFRMLWAQ